MSTPHRTRLVNPRLGTYFGIFSSAFAGLFLVLMILEQLDAPAAHLKLAVLIGPLVLFVAIGAASFTTSAGEFFAAGRRVPAVYNGLVFAISTIGGTGLVAFTGLFFINGFDTWFLAIGISSGFLVMGIAISPYLRKFGAYTVPSYLARRFDSRMIRIVAATVFSVPVLLLLAAELGVAIQAAALLTGYSRGVLAMLFAATLLGTLVFGGMRAVGWVSTAQSIAAIIAIVVLAAMMGLMLTNLPIAQFSYGPVLRQLGSLEEMQNIPVQSRSLFDFGLAGQALEPLGHRLATPFASIGGGSFIAGSIVVMLGVAGAPWLLPRCATTLGVYEARKSLGWAIFFAGVIILTLSAVAVFLRRLVMANLVGSSSDQLPSWFGHLREVGLAAVDTRLAELPLSGFLFARDGVLYAVPIAMEFPAVVLYLLLAGAVAAALAAAGATSFALSAIVAEDVFGGLKWEPASDGVRTMTARVMCAVVVALGLAFYSLVNADPLELFLSAMALSAASAFPVIALSIWWKRLSVAGAVASMITGFVVCVVLMLAGASNVLPIAIPVAGFVAVVLAICAAVGVSSITPVPGKDALEAAREMRIPGGETVYDREIRHLRFRQRGQD